MLLFVTKSILKTSAYEIKTLKMLVLLLKKTKSIELGTIYLSIFIDSNVIDSIIFL